MEYPAHAFHPSLENGRTSGRFEITSGTLVFFGKQGQIKLPLQGLQFSLGGASNRLLYIQHPGFPDWKIYTSEKRLLDDPLLAQHPDIQRQRQQIGHHHRMNRALSLAALGLIVILPLALLFSMSSVTGVIARQFSPSWEAELGKKAFALYQVDHELMKDADAVLLPLTTPLLGKIDDKRFSYHIYIVNNPELNAFALPGGYMVVNSGLIQAAETPEEVLGVIAHEISHVTEQHGIRNMISSAGAMLILQAVIGQLDGMMVTLAGAAPMLLTQSYSRGFESEADARGFDLLQRAEINPEGLVVFFQRMQAEEKKKMEKLGDEKTLSQVKKFLSLLSTHPDTDQRIAAVQKRLATLPKTDYRHLDNEFTQLKQSVAIFVADNNKSTGETTRETTGETQDAN
jgi:predicted Zn-dependent protease